MTITVRDILSLFGVKDFSGPVDVAVNAVTIDSRSVGKNDVFVAIRGEHQDGHDFIPQALAAGACLCVSEKPATTPKTVVCKNTTVALGEMAHWYRQKLNMPIIAITGSSGKTTTKNLLLHVLAKLGKTQATRGNLNNHWGVPLTLLSFPEDARYGIVEMGMNHAGEIAALCQIAEPNIGLITNVGPAHIENFAGKIENIASAKGELFAALTSSGTAIVNADDPLIVNLPTRAPKISFGFAKNATVRAENGVISASGSRFTVIDGKISCDVILPLLGKHHVQNALAVLAIVKALGHNIADAAGAFSDFQVEKGRGQFLEFFAGQIMDDTYNANPASMQAAFATLTTKFPTHRKIAVLGDMFELGASAAEWHRQVGAAAKQHGIDEVYALGQAAKAYLQGFGYAPGDIENRWFETHADLAKVLRRNLKGQNLVALLIKGSRGMKMETVLRDLMGGE